MKKKLLIIPALLLGVSTLTGCSFTKEKVKEPTLVEKVVVTSEEEKTLEKISKLVFNVEKEELKVNDLTGEEKGSLAVELTEGRFLDTSGSEMTSLFKKYFGDGQKPEYGDIKCFMKHEKESEQTLYYFDKDKDKYVYNEEHPGHGGGGNAFIGSEEVFDSLEIIDKEYHYKAKVLFYGTAMCHDIGPCEYGKAYKSYSSAKNETDPLTTIDNNNKYSEEDYMTGLPIVHLDKVIEDYKDQLDTYEFIFVKEHNNLVFKEYHKEK